MTNLRIGFIGVGAMGMPMALNLRRADFPVAFATRRTEAVDTLTAAGAMHHESPAAVGRASDIVCICVPADAEIEAVMYGNDGLLAGLAHGGVIVEMSTATPGVVQRAAEAAKAEGIDFLDCPVSGGVRGAHAGTLTMMVGGDEAVLERCRPALAAMGKEIFLVGPVGMAKTFKLINQMLNGAQLALVGEALALGARAGADVDLLYDVIKASSGDSYSWRQAMPLIKAGQDGPVGFKLDLMRKDMRLALQLGQEGNLPLDVAAAAYQRYAAAAALGLGERNSAEVARVLERLLDIHLA